MSDITQAREDFLSTFPSQYREHIIQFGKKVSRLDVDVLILTARKAVCLFHCFESLGVFERGKRVVISERWMEHDRSWLKGRTVAIVDEVIVTGTSIYKLYHELVQLGAARVDVHCLFINGDYFVEDFFKKINLSRAYIRLSNEEAQALSTAIVDAMYHVPRPYSVDYPMSTWVELSQPNLFRLTALPGWQTVERHWMDSRDASQGRRTTYFRVTPRVEMAAEIDAAIGANVYERSLAKIRLYGAVTGQEDQSRYQFRMVPYIVLGELQLTELEKMFAALISELSLGDQETVIRSCISEESRLRFVQYVFSSRLAQFWVDALALEDVPMQFRQDSVELSYIFPNSLHQSIQQLSRTPPPSKITITWPEIETAAVSRPRGHSTSDVPVCRVGGGAPQGWPPSAAQTARAVFPHAAFTKTQHVTEMRSKGLKPTTRRTSWHRYSWSIQ